MQSQSMSRGVARVLEEEIARDEEEARRLENEILRLDETETETEIETQRALDGLTSSHTLWQKLLPLVALGESLSDRWARPTEDDPRTGLLLDQMLSIDRAFLVSYRFILDLCPHL